MPSPPARKPWFFDALTGAEATAPDTAQEVAWLLDAFASAAEIYPRWRVEDGPEVTVSLGSHDRGRSASILVSAERLAVTITLAPDPSGYLLAIGHVAGAEVFRAYVDRPYEEHEVWPPGASGDASSEPPGRVGKRRTWVSLSAQVWPALAPWASGGWFNASVVED